MTDRLAAAVEELVEAIRAEVRDEVERASGKPDRLLLSIVEACEVLGLSRTQVYSLVSAGRLRTLKVGRRRLVPSSAIDDYIASA